MTTSVLLRCRCGKVRGTLLEASPRRGRRVVCYCDDCQASARFLGTDGLVDAHGGTDLFQTWPSNVRIDAGADEIGCMRLSSKGMYRWYASCCRTPIGNTLPQARAPFLAVHAAFVAEPEDERSRDAMIGPVAVRVQGRYAIGGAPEDAEATASFATIVKTLGLLGRGILARGAFPSAFFDAKTGAPRVAPEVLTDDARAALR